MWGSRSWESELIAGQLGKGRDTMPGAVGGSPEEGRILPGRQRPLSKH